MFRLILILVLVTDIMTGCPTVLLPAKVVLALNLNLEGMGAQAQFQPRFNGSFTTDSGKYCLPPHFDVIIKYFFLITGLSRLIFCFVCFYMVCEDTAAARPRSNNILSHQKHRNGRPQPVMSNEVSLPSEWTYWPTISSGCFTTSVGFCF